MPALITFLHLTSPEIYTPTLSHPLPRHAGSVRPVPYVDRMSPQIMLFDEDLRALIQIFRYFEVSPDNGGTAQVTANGIPREVAAPFFRAAMRREARLMTEDADRMRESLIEPRTRDQRRADACLDVMESIVAASRYLRHGIEKGRPNADSPRFPGPSDQES